MMLKLAEITLRPADEALPKVVIHLPPTPVNEQPPNIPLILNKSKAGIKLGQTPGAKAEVSTPTGIAKIRLPSIPSNVARHGPPVVAPNQPVAATPTTKKKVKVPPKPQSGKISNVDFRACRNALKRLLNHKNSPLFRLPVDPVRDKVSE
jgi:transcription initiation factor TFIID subunit 2